MMFSIESAGPRSDELLESRIRSATACGEFEKARQLWNAYMVQLEEELRRGSFSDGQIQQVRSLVEWCKGVALCARLHAQDRLNSLLVAAEYGNPPLSPPRQIIQVNI
jgi:hypothetical protein